MENNLERLQKVIANNSDISRRKAEELITKGKVIVNNQVVTQLGTKVSDSDEIIVDGQVIYHHEKVYYLLNKPIKTVSSRTDDRGRTTVVDLIHESDKIYPVGRLDYYTTGLLVLTNDGELANGLMHPRHQVEKRYRVKFSGNFNEDKLKQLRYGVDIGGYTTKRAKVKLISFDEKNKVGRLELIISEGKNQQVRKMIEAVGCKVLTLKRTGYGIFDLSQEALAPGRYRVIKPKEVKLLYSLIK